MITLFDYLPSQNGWKIRQLLEHLGLAYETQLISIFEGQGRTSDYLRVNPWGAVPAIRLDDGRVLAESGAILWYLAEGTQYRSGGAFDQAKILQWLSFESYYVEPSVGSLRYWTLTGKLAARPPAMVAGKRATAERALLVLDRALTQTEFIAGDVYSIADIAVFAYAHLAADAGLTTGHLAAFEAWVARVRSQPGFLAEIHPYSEDPQASGELP